MDRFRVYILSPLKRRNEHGRVPVRIFKRIRQLCGVSLFCKESAARAVQLGWSILLKEMSQKYFITKKLCSGMQRLYSYRKK